MEIPDRTIRLSRRIRGLGIDHLGPEIESALLGRIVNLDQRGCSPRLLEGFGHDDGDCLMVVLYLVATEQFGGVELAFL
ncbi:hypothetical protein D3C73_624230 [compost metagenome]